MVLNIQVSSVGPVAGFCGNFYIVPEDDEICCGFIIQ